MAQFKPPRTYPATPLSMPVTPFELKLPSIASTVAEAMTRITVSSCSTYRHSNIRQNFWETFLPVRQTAIAPTSENPIASTATNNEAELTNKITLDTGIPGMDAGVMGYSRFTEVSGLGSPRTIAGERLICGTDATSRQCRVVPGAVRIRRHA